MSNNLQDDRKIIIKNLLFTILITTLIFAAFIGQYLWSDVVTLAKGSDAFQGTVAQFHKFCEYILSSAYYGVDLGTFNGASELLLRPNMACAYLPQILACLIAKVTSIYFGYFILYYIQMLFCIYFSIALANRIFGISRNASLIFASSMAVIAMREAWYTSFYYSFTLIPLMLYVEISTLHSSRNAIKYFLLSFPYVLSLTTGYITTSMFTTGIMLLALMIYDFETTKENKFRSLVRVCIPFVISVCVCVIYYLEVNNYVKDVIQSNITTLAGTQALSFTITDFAHIVSEAFPTTALETADFIILGIYWMFIILISFKKKYIRGLSQRKQVFIFASFTINIIMLFIMLGAETPLATWFFSFAPIIGAMHLQGRYLMATLPFLYISLAMLLDNVIEKGIDWDELKKGIIALVIAILGLIAINRYLSLNDISYNILIIELLLFFIAIYFAYIYGMNSKAFAIFSICAILIPNITSYYRYQSVWRDSNSFKSSSVVFDEDKQKLLDDYIDQNLMAKERYNFLTIEGNGLPIFLPENYEWYGFSKHNISNYLGYDLHLSNPAEYISSFGGWFDRPNYDYIVNTRGDFIVLTNEDIDNNIDVLNKIVNWDLSNTYLDATHRILTLKKFYPKFFTQNPYTEDYSTNTLDNGYFYCPFIKQDQIKGFHTDNHSDFNISFSAEDATYLEFVPYPNRYYKYYVNGSQVEPIIQDMQAFIPVPKGDVRVEVKYQNLLAQASTTIILWYYVIFIVVSLIYLFRLIYQKNYWKRTLNKKI